MYDQLDEVSKIISMKIKHILTFEEVLVADAIILINVVSGNIESGKERRSCRWTQKRLGSLKNDDFHCQTPNAIAYYSTAWGQDPEASASSEP